MTKLRKKHSKEFKLQAVKMSMGDKTVREVAQELKIHPNLLSRWRKEFLQLGEVAFPGKGNEALTEEEKQIKALEKQLRETAEENAILKKAIRIFSRSDGKDLLS